MATKVYPTPRSHLSATQVGSFTQRVFTFWLLFGEDEIFVSPAEVCRVIGWVNNEGFPSLRPYQKALANLLKGGQLVKVVRPTPYGDMYGYQVAQTSIPGARITLLSEVYTRAGLTSPLDNEVAQ